MFIFTFLLILVLFQEFIYHLFRNEIYDTHQMSGELENPLLKSLRGRGRPSGLVPQMRVFRSESEVGVHSLSKALTTMRLVSVGSINPNSLPAAAAEPGWPTVSRGKHHGETEGSGVERLNQIMD